MREKRRSAQRSKRQADLNAKLVEAQIESTSAATEATKAGLAKTKFDTFRGVTTTIAIAYGVLAVFCYTFFGARFFPGGLTAGETLFFGFVAVALGLFGLMLSSFFAAWLLPFVSRPRGKSMREVDALRRRQIAFVTFLRKGKQAGTWRRVLLPFVVFVFAQWPRRSRLVWLHVAATSVAAMIILAVAAHLSPVAADLFIEHIGFAAKLVYAAIAITYFVGTWGLAARSDGNEIFSGFFVAFGSMICGAGLIWITVQSEGLNVLEGCVVGGFGLMGAFGVSGAQATAKSLEASSKRRNDRAHRFEPPKGTITFLICLAVVAPTFFAVISPQKVTAHRLARFVFGGFGIRVDDATLSLSAKEADAVQSASEINDIPVSLCKVANGRYLLGDVRVLWHGIGTKTYIEWPASAEAASAPTLKMDLTSAELNVIRGTRVRCIDIPDTAFFDSNRDDALTGDGKQDLVNAIKVHIAAATTTGQRLNEVDVIGHADPMPRVGGNEVLAKDRAATVARFIQSSFAASGPGVAAPVVKAVSHGSRDTSSQCQATLSQPAQQECNARNRGVEVRLRFVSQPLKAPGNSK